MRHTISKQICSALQLLRAVHGCASQPRLSMRREAAEVLKTSAETREATHKVSATLGARRCGHNGQ
jgi:hypothetical protein